jgi:hypothetical protein
MSRFHDKDLFGSGPHAFTVHGLEQRHATHAPPGADGAVVTTHGRGPRHIDQTGTLVGDDLADLQAQLDAIEAAMDGRAGTLVDDRGRSHERVVMLRFSPGAIRRRGARLAVDYEVAYLRSQP